MIPDQLTENRKIKAQYMRAYSARIKAQGFCVNCAKYPIVVDYSKNFCKTCYTKHRETTIQREAHVRHTVLTHYGLRCNCCGDDRDHRYLQIDHINGDGADHKQKSGARYKGYQLYKWIIEHNYPTNFQVLCANCNFAKGINIVCPCGGTSPKGSK